MTATTAAHNRLSSYVVSRRVELGHRSRLSFADAAGICARTLSDIENCRRSNFDRTTIAALEQALEWEVGSVAAVIGGHEPMPVTRKPTVNFPADQAIDVVMASGLPDDVKQSLARVLVDDRVAADRRRVDLARSLVAAVGVVS